MKNTYFTNLDNIKYKLNGKNFLVKDFWNEFQLIIESSKDIFDYYIIKDGQTPRDVSYEFYKTEDYDWVIMLLNEINYLDWPMNDEDLYDYAIEKYGINKLNDIHHYETPEVKNFYDYVVVPSGIIIPYNEQLSSDYVVYRFPDYDDDGITQIYRNLTLEHCIVVTNYEYEVKKNEEKRKIKILKSEYFDLFLESFKLSQSNS